MKKVFSFSVITSSFLLFILISQNWIISVEAATNFPENHTIEQLKVEWRKDLDHGYLVDVGERKGTLLIRVDQPKTETNSQWKNWSITKTISVGLFLSKDTTLYNSNYLNDSNRITYFEDFNLIQKHGYDALNKRYGKNLGYMKFSDLDDENYYIGMALYHPKKLNSNGIYWFGGNGYALREIGQVKAYFFHDVDVVEKSMKRVKKDGTFPLMNKVMWGKTELWKGQLGKVTIKKPETLWKRLDNGQLEKVRDLKQGDEFRVYRYIGEEELYGVGSGMYVKNNSSEILYETPSKKNLRLIRIMNGEE